MGKATLNKSSKVGHITVSNFKFLCELGTMVHTMYTPAPEGEAGKGKIKPSSGNFVTQQDPVSK